MRILKTAIKEQSVLPWPLFGGRLCRYQRLLYSTQGPWRTVEGDVGRATLIVAEQYELENIGTEALRVRSLQDRTKRHVKRESLVNTRGKRQVEARSWF